MQIRTAVTQTDDTLMQALLDAMPGQVAVIDKTGAILLINEVWRSFAEANAAPDAVQVGVGLNYLDVCRKAVRRGNADAQAALDGILAVLQGRQPAFTLEYPYHAPSQAPWFLMRVVPVGGLGAVISHTDISDRKLVSAADQERRRIELALRESEARLRVALESAQIGLHVWDAQAGTLYWDARVRELWDVGLDEPIDYRTFLAGIHPEDRARVDAAARRALDPQRGTLSEEYRVIGRGNRVERWVHATGRVMFESNRPLRMIGTVQDISVRKSAQEALIATERRFREIADTAPAILWIADAEGSCTFLSRGWYEFTGQALGEGLGFGWIQAVHPQDRTLVEAQFTSANASRGAFQIEYRLRRRDGEYRWVIDAARPRFAADGGFLGQVGSLIDITERKAAETSLHQREQDLATAFRVNPQAMFIVRLADHRYVEVNEPWEQLTGYSRAEAIGRTSLELNLYDSAQDRARFYQELQRLGAIRDFEFDTLDRSGKARRVAVSAEVAQIGGEPCVIGVASDITTRRQVELERARRLEAEREARHEAERANRIMDEFLATVSHELRTPLNAMLGWSHILTRRGNDPAMLKEGLSMIERNARAQAQLIADLLDMSRIVSGKLRLEMESVDLHEVVRAAIETVSPAAQAKRIQIRVVLEPRMGPVQGDPQRLQQVVWNVLSNAVKFTPAHGEVEIAVTREASAAQIRVTDTGQGIAPDLLPHVFDRFRQADSSTTRRHGGLGLGLSIVKQLVELHGGTVRADSPGVNRGSTFVIQLPLLQAGLMREERSVEDGAARDPARSPVTLAGLLVLAVDDEPDALAVVRCLLEDCQAQVVTAGSAAEALALIAERQPDVLLSDIGMPDIDGYELIRRIRASSAGADLPAVALTAYARDEDQVRALRAGYQAHVAKPLQPAELLETVALLAGRLPPGG